MLDSNFVYIVFKIYAAVIATCFVLFGVAATYLLQWIAG